jgi:phage-related minor tail protein
VLGKLAEGEYETLLAIEREYQQKSIQSFTEYFRKRVEQQGDAGNGASKAVKTYLDEAANVAQSTNDLVSNSLRGLEDGLTDFLTTGKFKYKEFATSIVAEINRIIIKQQIANLLASQMGSGGGSATGSIGSILSALLGSGGGSTMSSGAFGIGVSGFAMGGSVERGRIVEVNEGNGPGELFNVGNRQYLLASQAGSVEPQKASSQPQGQAMTVIQNFMLSAPADRRTQAQVAAAAGRGIQTAMARNS